MRYVSEIQALDVDGDQVTQTLHVNPPEVSDDPADVYAADVLDTYLTDHPDVDPATVQVCVWDASCCDRIDITALATVVGGS
jgi:hypothetical protein